ncbi:unnamed protein product [Ectocarpus sp. 6 AP-2014]
MSSPREYSVARLHPRVPGTLVVALWLLGTAQCLVAPPSASLTGGVPGARIVGSRSWLDSSPCCVRQSSRGSRARTHVMVMPGGGRGGGGRGGRGRGRGRGSPPDAFALGGEERLQKFLSHAGLDSRRQCEQMILDGRVRVNGKMVKELGVKVNPRRDQVHVDGNRVSMRPDSEIKWVALNKPKGVICTVSDELGRPTAVASIPRGLEMRLVPVGRLDRDSCGLLLLTNENSWINPLTHPSYGHEKTYRVALTSGYPTTEEWDVLTQGMLLDGDPNPTRPCIVEVVNYDRRTRVTTVDIIIREGKNRQIRRMFEGIGHEVKSITRVSHGPIRLKNLRPGEWRELEQWEIAKLKNLTTKTLKSPAKQLAPSPTRAEGRHRQAAAAGRMSSRMTSQQQSHGSEYRRDALDEEEDEWNQVGAWDRSGVRKAVAPSARAGAPATTASARGGGTPPQGEPAFFDDDDHEWQTASWARQDEKEPTRQGTGKGSRSSSGKRKARVNEGDRILERIKKGDVKLEAPAWEGGGKVDRDNRSTASRKKSWPSSRNR